MRESLLTAKIITELKRRIRAGERLWFLKIHGGPFQRSGVPDLLIVRNREAHGEALWVEVKGDGEVTRLQAHTIGQLRRVGCRVLVARSVDDVLNFLNEENA